MNGQTNTKTLVLYYSLSGHTRKVAAAIAAQLGADLEEIRCPRYQRGPLKYLRAALGGVLQRRAPIAPLSHAYSDYGLVIVGGPIWAGHIAPAVRTLLQQEKGRPRNLAFFLTHGGSPAGAVFAEMQQVAQIAPTNTLAVLQRQVEQGDYAAAVGAFAATLRTQQAA